MIITIAWVAVTMTIIFQVIKHTIGLRVSAEEEIAGLDSKEHGLASAYDGFVVNDNDCTYSYGTLHKKLLLSLPHLLLLLNQFLNYRKKAFTS